MTRKLLLLAATSITTVLGCVGNGGDSPVQVLASYSVDATCSIQTAIQAPGASYDLAGARLLTTRGAAFADVFTTFQLKSEFTDVPTRTNGRTLSDESRNGVYIDQVQLSYRSTPPISFEAESYPMHAFIEAGGTLNGVTDVLGTKAAQKLLDAVSPTSEVFEVIVNVRFRGYTAGSTGATFTTNDIEFPLRVFDSGPLTCAAGPAFDGPCGALTGQNGASCGAADGGI